MLTWPDLQSQSLEKRSEASHLDENTQYSQTVRFVKRHGYIGIFF